ncbi:RNA binding protein MSSP-2 [Blastomyces gilchristii SLH14081]|uniref:RNA binding protein MSSP-2 n=1 Tax=Blastomyces gilchristii (strain SLH14081) TaxID=559298 RepID=A0A179UUK6_BLAGS|nr:RNA binding protein MSSP-2 [Blastomyces gilchristii SLH14081]OAT10731.1 RNA binding protein MSSP-2 [Blastomyces gilchristii SLH14081]
MDILEKLGILAAKPGLNGSSATPFIQKSQFANMQAQTQQQQLPGEASAAHAQNQPAYNMEHQNRFYQHVPQTSGVNGSMRDPNVQAITHAVGGLNLQNQRHNGKFVAFKGNLHASHGSSGDMASIQRPYNGQYLIVPNGSMFGGVPTANQYGQLHVQATDQGNSVPYLPAGLYPNFVTAPSVVPGSVPGYTWPYAMNGDAPELSGPRRDSWSSIEENHPCTPGVDQAGHQECYPAVAPTDRSPMLYNYGTPSPSMVPPQPYLPYQMMKGAGGYVLQDLDALTQQDPAIPRAVPAMWTNPSDLTLAKCLENREGITNVYIRGFLPETTDEMLHAYASRFGKIDRCKAIVDLETGLCKGFGFVQFFSFDACENCIRGFFHLGYQASFAQKSRNSRLKDLEDKSSTNVYCTNVPIDWVEADLRRHFQPYQVVSEKISRDEKTGVSKEVGFARFESREIAEKVLSQFHNITAQDGVKLLLRFADTKAQKQLKLQSNERRAYRAGEYNYSVEMVNGSTPSPTLQRLQQTASHFSPNSQASFPSPLGPGPVWTPATSISPPGPMMNKSVNSLRLNSWGPRSNGNIENTPTFRGRPAFNSQGSYGDSLSTGSSKTVLPVSGGVTRSENSSPRKENYRAGSTSPLGRRREITVATPKSST